MKLAKTFQILEADRRPTLLLGLTHFLVSAAHGFFDIAATVLLIGRLGPDRLPEVYLAGAALLIFAGLVIIPIVDRLDRAKLFALVLVLFGSGLLVSSRVAPLFPDFAYRGLYVACFLMKALVFLQFWLLAGDLLDLRQAKRLFPVLLGFSLVGGVIASGTATILPRFLPPEALLAISGVLLLATLVPVRMISAEFRLRGAAPPRPPRRRGIWGSLRQDVAVSWETPLLRTLSLFILLLALLAQVLDFVLGKAAHLQFTEASGVALDSLTSFYALLNGIVIGAGVLVQVLFANRFISSVGVTRGELLAPIAFLGAFLATGAAWLASGGRMSSSFFAAVVVSRAVQKVLRISIVRTSTDLIYNAIGEERRGRAKAFKETVIEPMGVLLSGLFLLAAARLPLPYILGGSILVSVLFLASTMELTSRYLDSLVQVLKEKSRFRFAFPSMVVHQQNVASSIPVSGVRRALENDAASVRLLAVEVASELKEPEVAKLLEARFGDEPDPEVRARMLRALGKMLRDRAGGQESEIARESDPVVRASDMESIAQSGMSRVEDLMEPEPSEPAKKPPALSARMAPAAASADRREMLLTLSRSRERDSFDQLLLYLEEGDGATRHLAARTLETLGEPAVDVLTLALWSTDVEARRHVIRALGRIGTPRARQALLPVLSLEAEEAYFDLARLEALRGFFPGPAIRILCDSIIQRVERARRNAHQVLRSVFLTEPGMRLILSNLSHPDRYVRSRAIEALELRVDSSLLGGILPLFEHESPRSIAEHGGVLFTLPSPRPKEVLRELTRHRSSWIRACAAYAIGQVGTGDDLAALRSLVDDSYDLAQLNAIEAMGRIGDSTILPFLETVLARSNGKAREYVEVAIARVSDSGR